MFMKIINYFRRTNRHDCFDVIGDGIAVLDIECLKKEEFKKKLEEIKQCIGKENG